MSLLGLFIMFMSLYEMLDGENRLTLAYSDSNVPKEVSRQKDNKLHIQPIAEESTTPVQVFTTTRATEENEERTVVDDDRTDSNFPQVLKPPFRILQIGATRSGSTFQFLLLKAIVALKTPSEYLTSDENIVEGYIHKPTEDDFRELLSNDETAFVIKVHYNREFFPTLQEQGKIAVFSTGNRYKGQPLYDQSKESLYDCRLCEVEKYRPFFKLSDADVEILTTFMEQYSILRQCCSFQMSKYERQRLNGCNMTEYENLKEYPRCEDHNLQQLEDDYFANPINKHPFVVGEDPRGWESVRNCAKSRGWIRKGRGFNNATFEGC